MRTAGHLRPRRLLATLVAVLALLVALPTVAHAHTLLQDSEPRAAETIPTAPARVTLTFSEPVQPASTALTVLDDHLRPVATGPLEGDSGGTSVSVSLPPRLAPGTYTVSWRVISEDTHAVSGSFRFSIGAPTTVTGTAPGAGARSTTLTALLGLTHGLGYVGLALGPALLFAVLVLWPAGLSDRRVQTLIWTGLGLLFVSTVGARLYLALQVTGLPFSTLWMSPDDLDTHSPRFDLLTDLRFYLTIALVTILVAALFQGPMESGRPSVGPAGAVRAAPGGRRPLLLIGATVLAWLGLLVTSALAGHSATGDLAPLAIGVKVLHLAAMSLWLGGLALVVTAVAAPGRHAEVAVVMPAFSRLAFTSVLVIVATGGYLTLREVGLSFGALTTTDYGRLLLLKVSAVVVLVALGNLGRLWVRRHLAGPAADATVPDGRDAPTGPGPVTYGPRDVSRLRRGVSAEVVIALVVLGLTSALVGVPTARQDYAPPFHTTVTAPGTRTDVYIAKPKVGDTTLRVRVTSPDGAPIGVQAMTATITASSSDAAPIALVPANGSGASADGRTDFPVSFPSVGSWTIRLTIRTSELDATALSTKVTIT
ncbi:copper resistance CopC/CopD family protein [Raineyella fluvialis]|uniref:Copper transport protein n=1 Tax=Raineyella fluvialis TaxID=2662261 RepID=A0A5Q2FHF9_9ACTN|nr:copper resistance protein CopC [Raineyella fluvialis]QGF24984.1 hypothetical protein Rai3103_16730 [Raineyella fluvialis]